ncbi:hypothetical protein ACB098_01G294100 [Castanea mollissima]
MKSAIELFCKNCSADPSSISCVNEALGIAKLRGLGKPRLRLKELKDLGLGLGLGLGLVDMEVEAVSVLEFDRNEDVEESIDKEPETILLSLQIERESVCVL